MDGLKRIRTYLEESNGREPWSYGFNEETASPKAKAAWDVLPVEEKLAVSVYNPYRRERNAMLCELHRRGLTQPLIAELSGLSPSVVEKITNKKKDDR